MRKELLQLFGKQHSTSLDIAKLPDFMQLYLEDTMQSTDAKPGLLLTSWLPHCAVNIGNRVYMVNNSTRIYPNIWSCVIGPSSISRKSTALRFAGYTIQPWEDKLQNVALESYETKTQILNGTTLSKLMSYLSVNPARLFVHNEIAGWLHEMNKSFNAGYKQVVTELFDGVDRTIANRERTEIIRKPALSIAAASTEGWLFNSMLDGVDQLGGFLQRMLFYVVRQVNFDEVDFATHAENDLEYKLGLFDEFYFDHWRSIPDSHRLFLSPEALAVRDEVYEARYKEYFTKNNDNLMSYFTRIYDGYWFKFCIIITLAKLHRELEQAVKLSACPAFFERYQVSAETAREAFYLCDFYLENTIPLLEIMDEQDKLSGERKLVEILVNKYDGKVLHSALLNSSHMKKREFKECVESLIEREAITVESYRGRNGLIAKLYRIDQELLESCKDESVKRE